MNRNSILNFNRLFVVSFIMIIALALPAYADTGVYNYNITIQNPYRNYSIGENMQLTGFVSYLGYPVKEYPCILTFYDVHDNHSLFSTRIYTDELGQFLYNDKVGDIFTYRNNYTYFVQCSNTTADGAIYTNVGSMPAWFINYQVYLNNNNDWLVLAGIMFLIITVLVMFYLYAFGFKRDLG